MLHYLTVFFISMVPVVELRGAIPAGIAMGLPPLAVLLVSVLGNIVPVPFVILFIRRILSWMMRRGGALQKAASFLKTKAERGAELFYKYELLGLFILVAIPLPGTGAWTGALVSAMLEIRLKKAIPLIALGVLTAGIVMLCISYGAGVLFRP